MSEYLPPELSIAASEGAREPGQKIYLSRHRFNDMCGILATSFAVSFDMSGKSCLAENCFGRPHRSKFKHRVAELAVLDRSVERHEARLSSSWTDCGPDSDRE